ncbi:hypothetical protein [Sphingomonas sp. JC676]|nr:hypothetical protein [Sphingomonas sp. JC676]
MFSSKRAGWRGVLRFFALSLFLKVAFISAAFLFAADRISAFHPL